MPKTTHQNGISKNWKTKYYWLFNPPFSCHEPAIRERVQTVFPFSALWSVSSISLWAPIFPLDPFWVAGMHLPPPFFLQVVIFLCLDSGSWRDWFIAAFCHQLSSWDRTNLYSVPLSSKTARNTLWWGWGVQGGWQHPGEVSVYCGKDSLVQKEVTWFVNIVNTLKWHLQSEIWSVYPFIIFSKHYSYISLPFAHFLLQ